MAEDNTRNTLSTQSTLVETNIIQASWERCQKSYRLQNNLQLPVLRMTKEQVDIARRPMAEILFEGMPIIERVRHTALNTNYCVLICDNNGTVIESYADSSASRELSNIGLRTGGYWNEKIVGTNGVGTSIIARRPVSVCGRDHYNTTLQNYTCCAAPFFTSDGKVLGVIDVSGRSSANGSEHIFAEHFVREAASNISRLLFRKQHQNDRIVIFSENPTSLDFAPKAMIAANDHGQIIGATREALAFLGVSELDELQHRTVDSLWNVSIDDLKPMTAHQVRLTAPNGTNAYATTYVSKETPHAERTYQAPIEPLSAKPLTASPQENAVHSLDRIAGSDAKMAKCVQLSRNLLESNIPLLLHGETGVGKDRFARAFHQESSRCNMPYTAVNCAAIPKNHLASELFGYASGNLSEDLNNDRAGKVTASSGGTLFLDEIGDMPFELQARFLQLLEDGTITPLGATEPTKIDVRILCATQQDLSTLVARGEFRKDLYYRIKGAQLTLLPLRERGDIEQIIATILEEERGAHHSITISNETLEIFRNYTWPGNIRELRSVLRLILSAYNTQHITPDLLPDDLINARNDELIQDDNIKSSRERAPSDIAEASASRTTLGNTQELAEKEHILEALKANRWRVTKTAKELAVSRSTLHRKIRKYGLISPNERQE